LAVFAVTVPVAILRLPAIGRRGDADQLLTIEDTDLAFILRLEAV
jgi:hypothetical protein